MRLTEIHQCLADDTRLRILNLLTSGPLCVSHFQEVLEMPQVKISKHLAYLRAHNIVEVERVQNWMVYCLPRNPSPLLRHSIRCLQDSRSSEPILIEDLQSLHTQLADLRVPASDTGEVYNTGEPFKILFLCTGNSARSIIAEFLTRHLGGERFHAASAGSEPRKTVNPYALRVLEETYGVSTKGAHSKSWTEFKSSDFDFIITLCDKARETCPTWKGNPITAHWEFEDPAAFEGSEKEKLAFFLATARQIEARLKRFTEVALETLDRLRLEHTTRSIGFSVTTSASRTPATSHRRS